jgi:quinol monooxygenase YgiN
MKKIQLTARFKIHTGKLEEAKKIASECIALVKENEAGKGALQYDWFFSLDETECVVRETYVDSNSVLVHMGNVGEPLGRMIGISDFSLEVYGNPSEELQKAAGALGPKVYTFHQGL